MSEDKDGSAHAVSDLSGKDSPVRNTPEQSKSESTTPTPTSETADPEPEREAVPSMNDKPQSVGAKLSRAGSGVSGHQSQPTSADLERTPSAGDDGPPKTGDSSETPATRKRSGRKKDAVPPAGHQVTFTVTIAQAIPTGDWSQWRS